jgi:hypothetical protein
MLYALARFYAKKEAIERIRASGRKVTDFAYREIMGMADDLLLAEPQPFIQKAMKVLAEKINAEQAKPVAAV